MSDSPARSTGSGQATFVLHAAAALAALLILNYLVAVRVPIVVEGIEYSYWIFFYHLPAALNCYIFFTGVLIASIGYLRTEDPRWDQHARVAGEIGVLACTITLATGSCWARMAWNKWWIPDDPRLLSAAFMWLVYIGYVTIQTQMEAGPQRRRWAAVLGVLAFVNVPLVHFAIRWLGSVSHPQEVKMDSAIRWTAWFGVLAFFAFYSLIYRWKLAGDRAHDRLAGALASLRRVEEGANT